MVSSDGSGLAELAIPNDPAAGADSGFSTHSVSPDSRWLAYSPRPPRDSSDAPPGQTIYFKDLFLSDATRPVADFSRVQSLDLSPGGKQIIVSGTLDPAAPPGSVTGEYFLVDVETGSVRDFPALRSALSANWSPAGDRILGVFPATGGGSRLAFFSLEGAELVSVNAPFGHLAWSPDGTRLAVGAPGGTAGVYIIAMDGSIHHISSVHPHQSSGMTWSPDANRIALTLNGWEPSIGILDVTTTELRPLGPGESPAWSPDGNHIAYVDAGWLRLIDAHTGAVSPLVSPAQPLVSSPRWLADDAGVVFHYAPRFLRSISTANPDGSNEQHIAYGDGPAWSPDGRLIAFLGRMVSFGLSGFEEVYVMNRDGTDPRKLAVIHWTDALICPTRPPGLSWSEDGTRVLYYDQSRNGVFAVPATGEGAPELVSADCPPPASPTPATDVIPSPTGDAIIIVR
jgi:Tol biopolymer transport system component